MPDRATQVLLDGLARAAVEPGGAPLHAHKSAPGLFAPTASGRQAAQRSLDEGFLCLTGTEGHGRSSLELFTLTEKGRTYLLGETSPRQVLEDLVRALEMRHDHASQLITAARGIQASVDALKGLAAQALAQLNRPALIPAPSSNGHASETWPHEALHLLAQRHADSAPGDFPLPDLYERLKPSAPRLTIGRFHDGLRQLHEEARIYLHPWTGPLYDLPEPRFALLVGHEIAYYASIRR